MDGCNVGNVLTCPDADMLVKTLTSRAKADRPFLLWPILSMFWIIVVYGVYFYGKVFFLNE